jgi:hypothetical protein
LIKSGNAQPFEVRGLRLEATAVIGMPPTSSEALLKFPALLGRVLQLFVSVK